MKPLNCYEDDDVAVWYGDARDMRFLADESVQCVMTSPPYWGLRVYEAEDSVWGGDSKHEHECGLPIVGKSQSGSLDGSTLGGAPPGKERRPEWVSAFCACGAWKGSLGLEPTPELYVEHLVTVFREVRRVLRKDGVVWLNLGDSYAGSGKGQMGDGSHSLEHGTKQGTNTGTLVGGLPTFRPGSGRADGIVDERSQRNRNGIGGVHGLKPKDLVGIPWMVAFALRADGWWLRSPVVWEKTNPMPQSVTDRPTMSHEHVFLLTKSGAAQFWTHPRKRGTRSKPDSDVVWRHKLTREEVDYQPVKNAALLKELWAKVNLWRGHDYFYDHESVKEPGTERPSGNKRRKLDEDDRTNTHLGFAIPYEPDGTGRNLRSVWRISTQPFTGTHYAVFPEELVELCLKAGSSGAGACRDCGAPWYPKVGRTSTPDTSAKNSFFDRGTTGAVNSIGRAQHGERFLTRVSGWQPTCQHPTTGPVKSIVLDPFGGVGTVAVTARSMGHRKGVVVDIGWDYCVMAVKRLFPPQKKTRQRRSKARAEVPT